MTRTICNTVNTILVAIDVAKNKHDVVVLLTNGKKESFKMANTMEDYEKFSLYLKKLELPCIIGFEATGDYHRPIAYFLQKEGFTVRLVSSLAAARTREALHNSWDKNDPKDAQVILHLLKTGVTQIYHDPLIHKTNDIQEIAKTYHQISLRKVKVQHSIMNHYLPLYFPEVYKYFHSSRAKRFSSILLEFPTPSIVLKHTEEEFIKIAWKTVGRKVGKRNWLLDFYRTAKESVGLPISENSEAVKMFRIILKEHIDLCEMRSAIEEDAESYMLQYSDYQRLKSIPGIGPMIALIILAEAGDLKRKGYTAVAAKMARVAYSLIKYQTDYRCYHESIIPSGGIPAVRP